MEFQPIVKKKTAGKRKELQPYATQVDMPTSHEDEKSLEQVRKRLKNRSKTRLAFPVEVFPKRIQNVIKCFSDCFQLPIDYHAAGILSAASIAIGNGYAVRYKRGQVYPAIIWMAAVGFPSSGKSPGLDFGLYPLYEIEDEFRNEYQEKLRNWREECIAARIDTREEPPKPHSKDLLLNNATMEALNSAMNRNPKGLLMFQDELKAWILNMNSYRAGSDLEAWLSIWSGKSSKISRTGKDPVWIKKPYVSVVGSIQPGVLSDLATGGKAENGFLARILFAYPDSMECPPETDREPDESVYVLYRSVIQYLFDLPNKLQAPEEEGDDTGVSRIEIPLDAGARKRYVEFLNDYSRRMNADDDEQVKGILGKLKQYCLRLSLLLQMLDDACNAAPALPPGEESLPMGDGWDRWPVPELDEMYDKAIDKDNMERAITLTEYFRETAFKVIERLDSLVGSLPFHQKILYQSLPYEFTAAQMRDLADKMVEEDKTCKLSEKTLERLRTNKQLCLRVGRGEYRKLH